MSSGSNVNEMSEELTDVKAFIKQARELFRVCDKNDNGFISKRDMWKLCDELPLTPEQLEDAFVNLDEDKSDYLTEEEFIQGFALYLGVDLKKLKKEEEEEAKRKAEQKEDEELEDMLNQIDEHNVEDKAEIDKLWKRLSSENPELTTSEFESMIEDLGKGLRAQRSDNLKEVKKDLHNYYYHHIQAVMQHLEAVKCKGTNRKQLESPNLTKTNKSSNTLLQRRNDQNIRFNDISAEMTCDQDYLPSVEQQLVSPPTKARNIFLKSMEEPSSPTSQEGQHNSNKLINHSFHHKDNKEYSLLNNRILPVINSPERLFKIIFVGDSGVGKTSFIHRFCSDKFLSTYEATVGIDYRVKTFAINGHSIALQLWDTAGQERFRSITRQYFRKTDGIIFMYDITSELSFRNMRNWMAHVKEYSSDNLVSAVVGNKMDLSQKETPIVTTENGEQLAKKHKCLFYEISCKTGEGVWRVMSHIACALRLNEDQEIEKICKLQKLKEQPNKCC